MFAVSAHSLDIEVSAKPSKAKAQALYFTGEHFRQCHEAWWSLVESARWATESCVDMSAASVRVASGQADRREGGAEESL